MLLPATIRLAPVALLLTAFYARAQTKEAISQTTAPADTLRPLAHHLLGISFGFGISTVNPGDDYYLPNDGIKLGSEAAFTYTHLFSRSANHYNPMIGFRTGLGVIGRAGRYTFFGQEVRRNESYLTVPLELVTRRRWSANPRLYSTVALGGYFSELASRYTYTLNPATGKTQLNTDSWLYATGGLAVNFSVGYQHAQNGYRELGVRFSADLFQPRSPEAGQLPNLRQSNITLYYSGALGF